MATRTVNLDTLYERDIAELYKCAPAILQKIKGDIAAAKLKGELSVKYESPESYETLGIFQHEALDEDAIHTKARAEFIASLCPTPVNLSYVGSYPLTRLFNHLTLQLLDCGQGLTLQRVPSKRLDKSCAGVVYRSGEQLIVSW